MYKIVLTKQAKRAFDQLMKGQPRMGKRVAKAIDRIAEDPSIGIALRGELKGLHKYRVGSYRVIYQVIRTRLVITVIDIGHRKEVYR